MRLREALIIWVLAISPGALFGQATLTSPPAIASPMIPDRHFSISDYGAIGDGKTRNTSAIARAVVACRAAGGGTLEIPSGHFLTGPFAMCSNLNLRLDDGAVLVFSDDPKDYKIENREFQNCIQASHCHDIAITGNGTIDGQGAFWWKNFVRPKTAPPSFPMPRRPFLIVLHDCQRVLVQGITLLNSPNFHLVPEGCQEVLIDHIQIHAPSNAENTDGIDLSGLNCVVTNCTIDDGDDNLVLKPTQVAQKDRPSCENIWVSGCTFLHGHGMSIGGQSRGGLRNMMVRDCTFEGTDAGIRMKSSRAAGGLVENVTYEHLRMKHVKVAIFITSYYPQIPADPANAAAQPIGKLTPIWRHILIRDVVSEEGDTAGRMIGLPEMPISDVELDDVKLSADKGMQIIWADGVTLVNSRIQVTSGPPVSISHSSVTHG